MEQFAEGAQEDVSLLIAIKDSEINTLRQQLSQIADDLKRNLAVLSTKDEEVTKLHSTVDGMRALLAEKDNLFAQFQAQVEELEALRIEEGAKRVATEQLLASQQQAWKQHQGSTQKDKDAEISQLQQQLKDLEERWSTQLMQTRQTALDESIHRSTQQQSAIDRAAENEQRLQHQLETLGSALAVKEAELDSAHRQLAAALEGAQRMEATHAKAIAAKQTLISQLQQQLDQQTASIAASNGDHETNMAKLIASLNQMQESCKAQALEVQEYAAGQKRLQDERKVLKEQLKQQEAAITKLQTEKGVLEAALQHEVTAQASTQAQLNIFQAKLTEAVIDLEKRCAAAEARSSKLMAQLVEERGRLVDAVIEQANSSTPQLAAELAKALEADRLRTQAELQVAQERSRSLAEDLALIRSTLMPLVTAPAAAAAVASGAAPAAQQANGSLAALAQMMQHGALPAAVSTVLAPAAAGMAQLPGPPGAAPYCSPGCVHDRHATYTFVQSLAAPAPPPATIETGCSALNQPQSPARNNRDSSAANSPVVGSSAQLHSQYGLSVGHTAIDSQFISSTRLTPQRGSLAGLVCDLQADVDKLQQQLHSSRRQLSWEGQQSSNTPEPAVCIGDVGRLGSSGTCPHPDNSLISPAARQQLQQKRESEQLQYTASPNQRSHQQQTTSSPAGSADVDGSDQLTNALRYLLEKTEQLSAENGALKTRLEHSSPSKYAVVGALGDLALQRLKLQESGLRHSSSDPQGLNRHSSNSCQQKKAVVNHHRGSAAATANIDDCSEPSQQHDDSASVLIEGSNMGDDLSIAASEELAAAQAVAAAECSRHRRQARAAAAARKQHIHSQNRVDSHQYHSPVRGMLVRSSSIDSRGTQSDISSCSTWSPASAAATDDLHDSSMAGPNSSRQLLETVLASYPHNRLGKLMKELVSAINNGGGAAAAAAAGSVASKRGSCRAQPGRSKRPGNNSSGGANSSSHAAPAREQLRYLADLSPARQRLLRALAGAE